MRLKLVLIVSLLAAIVGAGSCLALVLGVFPSQALSNPSLLVVATLLLPVAAIIFASIFVYRHTARRRRLQAFLTVVLATLLTFALFVVASIVSARRSPTEPVQPAGPHITLLSISNCQLPIFATSASQIGNRQLEIGNRI